MIPSLLIAWIIWYLIGLSGFIVMWLYRYGEIDLLEFVVAILILGHGGIISWIYWGLTSIELHTREIIIFKRRR